nr:hypothetical protein [Tanacetum cinerariifolium]
MLYPRTSPLRRPFIRHPSPEPSISPPRVNAAKPSAVSAAQNNHDKWEVILNGDSPVPTRLVKSVAQLVAPTTIEQKLARKNELKARGTLLMALPDKHQLKFNSHKMLSHLWRLSRSVLVATLKPRRLQKLVSQLEIHGVSLS